MLARLAPLLLLTAALPAMAVELPGPVYLLSMPSAFDQYLAQQLIQRDAATVTADPTQAAVVLTDRIDTEFLRTMRELFPREGEQTPSEEDNSIEDSGIAPPRPVNRPQRRPQGVLFLVDVSSRTVLWSTFIDEFELEPSKLEKQAREVVNRLEKALAPPQVPAIDPT